MRSLFVCAAAALMFSTPAAFTVNITSPSGTGPTGVATTFTASASGGSGGLTYQWDFGDGTITAFDPANVSTTHNYSVAGHYLIRVNVEDSVTNTTTTTKLITIHYPSTAVQPTNSSTIILDAGNNRVWC